MKAAYILLGIAVVGAGAWYLTKPSIEDKRKFLQKADGTLKLEPFNSMSDQEINDSYLLIKEYVQKNKSLPTGTALQQRLLAISAKYKIFT